ncbi:MAG: hypothetical protein ABIT01_00840 [Thermoanaerobaculia bacterium]
MTPTMKHARVVGTVYAGPWLVPTGKHPRRAAFLVRTRRGAGGVTRRVIAVGDLAEACITQLIQGQRVMASGQLHVSPGRPGRVELLARRITIELHVTT